VGVGGRALAAGRVAGTDAPVNRRSVVSAVERKAGEHSWSPARRALDAECPAERLDPVGQTS
jgi:hypothetical protein